MKLTFVLLLSIALLGAGCPRGPRKPAPEPVAEPVPVEIDWPDGGVVGSDRDLLSPN